MSMRHTIAALSLGLVLAVAPAAAQDLDARWWPWVGCWQGEGAPGDSGLLCVLPSEQNAAVEVVRMNGAEVLSREVVWADGARHETARESCTGWEEGRFSNDGRRLYLRSEHTCDGVVQEGSGVLTMITPDEWLDIRTSGMGGENVAWVQRLWPATVLQIQEAGFEETLGAFAPYAHSSRMYASTPMDVDDILEAARVLPTEAVETLVAERGDRLDLDASEVLRMADAGLDERLIDVAVAVSFPERFALNSGPRGQDIQRSALDEGSIRRVWAYGGGWGTRYDPFYMGRFGFGYSPYGYGYSPYDYGYGYGYSPYGFGGYYGGYYGYRPTVIVVNPVETGPRGRVVNGRGYTRGGSGSSGSAGGSGAVRSGAAGASGTAGAASSGGSRGKATGRKAKRRGGGNLF